jgi:hypothetical protein
MKTRQMKQFTSSRTFHRTSYGHVREATANAQRGLEKLEHIDPVAQEQSQLLPARIQITAQMNETKPWCTCSWTEDRSRKRHCRDPTLGLTNPEQKIVEEYFRFRAETSSGSTGARPGENLLAPLLVRTKMEKN